MPPELTRRELIRAGGAGAAGLTLLGAAACDRDEPSGAAARRRHGPSGAMNVVVVVMDSLRADHIYGPRARTETMDAFAREALRFTHAYPEGMPTIPARRAIMSGRRTYPFRGWREYRDLPPQPGWEPVGVDGPMFTEFLRRHGWTVGYVTDNPHLLLPVHRRFRRRFDRVELVDGQVPLRRRPRRRVSTIEVDRHLPRSMRGSGAEPRMVAYLAANPRSRREEQFLAARVFREGIGWIEWARSRQPFALVVDSFDAHEPWDAPRRLIDLYGPRRPPDGVEPIQPFPTPAGRYRDLDLSRSLLRRMRQLYAAEVTLIDIWLGRFLARLSDLGLAGNTLVVLVSDHGVLLGEYGWVGKRYSEMHEELTHVPLMIRHPQGKAKGMTSRYYASTHDIGPTVLSVLGHEPPRHMNGVDLSPLLDGRPPATRRTYRTACYNDHVSASDGRWLLISDNRGREKRLYAVGSERRDLAASHPVHVRRLWRMILRDAGPKGLPRFRE
ncbi:MAG: sulfatase [Thermoleophilaceae bacterium]|nr:sulfatase [Thermoleophilaceae bacterium]